MPYQIREVAGRDRIIAATLHRFNGFDSCFPALEPRHLRNGFWWLVYSDAAAIAFAGMVPLEPFPGVGYLKRAYVMPAYRGQGLQRQLLAVRESKARRFGWSLLVSECGADNVHSADNFAAAGFAQCEPEQRWGATNSIYWKKELSA